MQAHFPSLIDQKVVRRQMAILVLKDVVKVLHQVVAGHPVVLLLQAVPAKVHTAADDGLRSGVCLHVVATGQTRAGRLPWHTCHCDHLTALQL
jgi:hypothetical protein